MKNIDKSVQLQKNSDVRRVLEFFAPTLIILCILFSNMSPIQSSEVYLEEAYPHTRTKSIYYQKGQSEWLDLSPSSPSRQVVCFVVKTCITSMVDKEIERRLPTRNNNQNIEWGNLVSRILFKGTFHFAMNTTMQMIETEKTLTQDQLQRKFYKTMLDVAISEVTNIFVDDENKELAKTLALGITHIIFKR